MLKYHLRHCAVAFVLLNCLAQTATASADDAAEGAAVTVRVVDEAGSPVADAVVEGENWQRRGEPVTTDADGLVPVPAGYERLFARSADGSLLGYAVVGIPAVEPIEVVLRPARVLDIVVLFEGKPVGEAEIEVFASYLPIAHGITNADGNCQLAIPRDAEIQFILACRSGVGFGGFARGNDSSAPQVSSDEYRFQLSPASDITVRVVDRNGRPVAGVAVYPWLVKVPGMREEFNIAATRMLKTTTDDRGDATFNIFPQEAEYVAFGAQTDENYHSLAHANWRQEQPTSLLTLEVWPLVTVSGQVTNPDGTPAAGVPVQIDGSGPQNSSVRREAVTDEQGAYEFRVPPDHAYVIGVHSDTLAAKSRSGFIVPEEGTLEGMNLELTAGTVFRGTVGSGDGVAQSSSALAIIEEFDSQAFVINGQQEHFGARFTRWAGLDESGHFEITLAPGSYYAYSTGIGVAQPEFFHFEVAGQEEITHDFVVEAPHTEELAGRVVRDVNGTLEPVVGVTVTGVHIDAEVYPDPTGVSDESGRFTMNWQPGKMLLHAMSADGAWGMTHMLQGKPEELEIVLLPTVSATGQMLGDGEPLPGFKFDYQIQVDLGEGMSTHRFGGKTETDEEGRFMLEHLIQGQPYWCSHHLGYSYHDVTTVTAADATPIDLGQLEYDSDDRARTPVERLNDTFQKTHNAGRHYRIALEEASFQRQNVLLIVGDREDAAVRNLFRLFFEEFDFWDDRSQSPLKQLLHDYELCALEAPRVVVSDGLPEDIRAASAGELPVLFILNPEGVLLGSLPAERLVGDDAKLNESAILELLNAHRPEALDAEQLLEEALTEAAAHDPPRLIIVHEVDTLLPKSRRLTRFLRHNAEQLGAQFVYFPVDPQRMAQGYELLDALASDQYGNERNQGRGSSWVGVMTAEGELLGSMKFVGNGIDPRPNELDEFIGLLRDHAPDISEEQLATWRAALQATQPYGLQ